MDNPQPPSKNPTFFDHLTGRKREARVLRKNISCGSARMEKEHMRKVR